MKVLQVAIHIVFIVFSLVLQVLVFDVLFDGFVETQYATAVLVLMYVAQAAHVARCTTTCRCVDGGDTIIMRIMPSGGTGCTMSLLHVAIIALFIYTSQTWTAYAIWSALLAYGRSFAIQLRMFAYALDKECT